MKPKEWYQAEIRWAVMVEGKARAAPVGRGGVLLLSRRRGGGIQAGAGNRVARARWP